MVVYIEEEENFIHCSDITDWDVKDFVNSALSPEQLEIGCKEIYEYMDLVLTYLLNKENRYEKLECDFEYPSDKILYSLNEIEGVMRCIANITREKKHNPSYCNELSS